MCCPCSALQSKDLWYNKLPHHQIFKWISLISTTFTSTFFFWKCALIQSKYLSQCVCYQHAYWRIFRANLSQLRMPQQWNLTTRTLILPVLQCHSFTYFIYVVPAIFMFDNSSLIAAYEYAIWIMYKADCFKRSQHSNVPVCSLTRQISMRIATATLQKIIRITLLTQNHRLNNASLSYNLRIIKSIWVEKCPHNTITFSPQTFIAMTPRYGHEPLILFTISRLRNALPFPSFHFLTSIIWHLAFNSRVIRCMPWWVVIAFLKSLRRIGHIYFVT
jgi:hypothetical protein